MMMDKCKMCEGICTTKPVGNIHTLRELRAFLDIMQSREWNPMEILKKFTPAYRTYEICDVCNHEVNKNDNVIFLDNNPKNLLPTNLISVCEKCLQERTHRKEKVPRVSVGKTMTFAGAHRLPDHPGKCRGWHGHEWRIEMVIKNHINPGTGMVADFYSVKSIMEDHLMQRFDHAVLNNFIEIPTAENLLVYIWEILMFEARVKGLEEISIWESSGSRATLTYEDVIEMTR